MNRIIKIATYTTKNSDELRNELFEFNEKTPGKSKMILNYLEENRNLDLIYSIKTRTKFWKVEYTDNANKENLVHTENFPISDFKNGKQLLDFLVKNKDLEFINSMHKIEIID
jgi:hypothetical protein